MQRLTITALRTAVDRLRIVQVDFSAALHRAPVDRQPIQQHGLQRARRRQQAARPGSSAAQLSATGLDGLGSQASQSTATRGTQWQVEVQQRRTFRQREAQPRSLQCESQRPFSTQSWKGASGAAAARISAVEHGSGTRWWNTAAEEAGRSPAAAHVQAEGGTAPITAVRIAAVILTVQFYSRSATADTSSEDPRTDALHGRAPGSARVATCFSSTSHRQHSARITQRARVRRGRRKGTSESSPPP